MATARAKAPKDFFTVPMPEVEAGEREGPWVKLKFLKLPVEFDALQVHWADRGFVPCRGRRCEHCLTGLRILQRYRGPVKTDLGEAIWEMNFQCFRLVYGTCDHVGTSRFLRRQWKVRRHGIGTDTTYEMVGA
jgi:hypothetical protein